MRKETEKKAQDRPQVLIWLVTGRCNLTCGHCYAARFQDQRELDTQEALAVLSEAAQAGVRHLGLSGGEPLLRRDTLTLIDEAARLGLTASVVTNGSLLTPEVAERLSGRPALVFLSMDGGHWETHERIRGQGAWRWVETATQNLRLSRVDFSTVMAVSRLNHAGVGEYLARAQALGAAEACLIPVMPSGRAGMELVLTPEEMAGVLREAERSAELLGFAVNLWCTPFAPALVSSRLVFSSTCRNSPELNIAPNGDVLLCDILDDVLSNVRERGVLGAYREQEASPLSRALGQPVLRQPCACCPALEPCRGGCFARARLLTGDIMAPDPLCPRVAKR